MKSDEETLACWVVRVDATVVALVAASVVVATAAAVAAAVAAMVVVASVAEVVETSVVVVVVVAVAVVVLVTDVVGVVVVVVVVALASMIGCLQHMHVVCVTVNDGDALTNDGCAQGRCVCAILAARGLLCHTPAEDTHLRAVGAAKHANAWLVRHCTKAVPTSADWSRR